MLGFLLYTRDKTTQILLNRKRIFTFEKIFLLLSLHKNESVQFIY